MDTGRHRRPLQDSSSQLLYRNLKLWYISLEGQVSVGLPLVRLRTQSETLLGLIAAYHRGSTPEGSIHRSGPGIEEEAEKL